MSNVCPPIIQYDTGLLSLSVFTTTTSNEHIKRIGDPNQPRCIIQIGRVDYSYHYMLIASLIFTYGRVAHAICFAFFDYNPFLRITGMLTTYVGIVMLCLKLISFYI